MSNEALATAATALPIPVVVLIAVLLWAGVLRALGVLRRPPADRARVLAAAGALLGAWLVLAFWLGAEGVFRGLGTEAFPPVALGLVLPVVALLALVASSKSARDLLAATPQHLLIGVQLYRVVGVVFLVLFALGRIPGAFAIPAGSGDLVVGVTAPVVASLYRGDAARWRGLAVAWNLFGLADLVVAVTMGVFTSPGRLQQFALDAPNVAIATFPLVLVPVFLVPTSIVLHLFSLARLRASAARRLAAA